MTFGRRTVAVHVEAMRQDCGQFGTGQSQLLLQIRAHLTPRERELHQIERAERETRLVIVGTGDVGDLSRHRRTIVRQVGDAAFVEVPGTA